MDLPRLRSFVEAARRGSFTEAARARNVAQPSLSQQISALEDELGQTLFDRVSRGVVLTEAGQRLLGHAERVLVAIDEATQSVRDADPEEGGRVSIGAIPTVAAYSLPAIISSFVRRYPRVEFSLHEDVTADLASRTAHGALDMSIISMPLHDPRLRVAPLQRERFVLAMSSAHPEAHRKRLRRDWLESQRFVMIHPTQRLGQQVLEFCHRRGFSPLISGQASHLSTIKSMVAAGLGISLIPQMATTGPSDEDILYRKIPGGALQRDLGLAEHRHRSRSAVVAAFRSHLMRGYEPQESLDSP